MIDDARAGHDPSTVLRLDVAPEEADPFASNDPARQPRVVRVHELARSLGEAADVKRMPAREAAFRNLVLNQRVEAEEPFLAAAHLDGVRRRAGRSHGPRSLCAARSFRDRRSNRACLDPRDVMTGIWSVKPTFWLPGGGAGGKGVARSSVL